jgi:hypothetical protein
VPLAITGGESCGAAGAFFLDVGISSTDHIAHFWRLHESLVDAPRAAAPVSAPIQVPVDRRAFVTAGTTIEGSHSSAQGWLAEGDSLAEGKERRTRYPIDPNATIAAAFKAAGLPVPEIPAAQPGATPRVLPDPIIVAALKARRPGAKLIRPSGKSACYGCNACRDADVATTSARRSVTAAFQTGIPNAAGAGQISPVLLLSPRNRAAAWFPPAGNP